MFLRFNTGSLAAYLLISLISSNASSQVANNPRDETGKPAHSRSLEFEPQSPPLDMIPIRLLPCESDQEIGNAVPVLLRLVYEEGAFIEKYLPKMAEYSRLDVGDPRLDEIPFGYFAAQIRRAGLMSFADWEYPLRSSVPFVTLPDIGSQRSFVGRGMTIWIKQRLTQGDITAALEGIQAQLACSRHIAQSPILVCHLVAVATAEVGLENIEHFIQQPSAPNLYWSLALLPNQLIDPGPMVRWENNSLPRLLPALTDSMPEIGDVRWQIVAKEFASLMAELSDGSFGEDEASALVENTDQLAVPFLADELGFTAEQLQQMTEEERIMRWILTMHRRFSVTCESLLAMPLPMVLERWQEMEEWHDTFSQEMQIKAEQSPFSNIVVVRHGMISSYRFGRRVRLLQTVEALRDYAAKHDGALPDSLSQLELPVPIDPFTGELFEYHREGREATLQWADVPGSMVPQLQYIIRTREPGD